MPDLCLITTCMGRLAHLQQTLGNAAGQVQASCVVVDFSCPDRCGTWVEQAFPHVKVVRVPGQSRFHPARARNAGAEAADAPWLCFFDADICLTPSFGEAVLPLLRPGFFYRPEPLSKDTWGTMLCRRDDFVRAGGYDEIIQGYGFEDDDLFARLCLQGLRQSAFPAGLLRALPHDDDMRVRFFDIKEKNLSQTINCLYSRAKIDLMRLTGQEITADNRNRLHKTVGQVVRQALESGREVQWDMPFRREATYIGWTSLGKLTYVIAPPKSN